jgi:hypothetical protein
MEENRRRLERTQLKIRYSLARAAFRRAIHPVLGWPSHIIAVKLLLQLSKNQQHGARYTPHDLLLPAWKTPERVPKAVTTAPSLKQAIYQFPLLLRIIKGLKSARNCINFGFIRPGVIV